MRDSRKGSLIIVAGAGLVLLGGWAYLRHADSGSPQAPAQTEPERAAAPGDRHAVPVDPGPPVEQQPAAPVPADAENAPAAAVNEAAEGKSVAVEERVKRLKSSSLRPRDFQARIKNMARSGDEVSVGILIALSDERYEELAVVEALGAVRRPGQRQRVGEHLRGKLADSSLSVLMASLQSYARVMGDASIPVVKESIRDQWRRPDGHGEMVCKAAVQGLGSIPTPAAQAALIAELDRVTEPGWLPDYGSAVVAELGKRNTPEAAAALRTYADALERKMPPENNPPGRQYYQEKIAEARKAASGQAPSEANSRE